MFLCAREKERKIQSWTQNEAIFSNITVAIWM